MDKYQLQAFEDTLYEQEKAAATIQKYLREVKQFLAYLDEQPLTKHTVLEYREFLKQAYHARTVNVKLSAIHLYLEFLGVQQCKVKLLRVQKRAFVEVERELSEKEYKRLLAAAKEQGDDRMYHLMMTIGGTGIRISELPFITVEALKMGKAEVTLKGKCREILLPKTLCKKLLSYASKKGIHRGYVFQTRTGRAMDRSNVCHAMKKICESASVNPEKVFPHNLRHLFARTYYQIEKNLAHLADILGHSSVETTRIYVAASIRSYEKTLELMRMVQ